MATTRSNPGGLDLHLELPAHTRRLRVELEQQLRAAVRDGRLRPGATLPPSRTLAGDLGVARNTVAEAYRQLVAEGWLVSRQGSATRVADRPAGAPAHSAGGEHRPARRVGYDLRAGFPDVTSFPRGEWLAAARAALAGADGSVFGYGPAAGCVELRTALAEYVGRVRGVYTAPARVVVCAGFAGGLRLLAGVLRANGVRRIGVEAHGHQRHRDALRAAGLRCVPLPVDDEGAVADGLDGVGAVLLTPAHQFPLGVALSAQRRAEFTRWAARTGAVLIEDDYDGEFRYDGRHLAAVQALAPEHVVYAGTASKTLAPGLRLGWLALPQRLVEPLVGQQHNPVSIVDQLTLARFLATGRYDRHVRRMRLAYRRRRDRLVRALARAGSRWRPAGMAAGLHTVVPLPSQADEAALLAGAAQRRLMLEALSSYSDVEAGRYGLVIGFGTPAPHAYATALSRLAATLRAR